MHTETMRRKHASPIREDSEMLRTQRDSFLNKFVNRNASTNLSEHNFLHPVPSPIPSAKPYASITVADDVSQHQRKPSPLNQTNSQFGEESALKQGWRDNFNKESSNLRMQREEALSNIERNRSHSPHTADMSGFATENVAEQHTPKPEERKPLH